jgi:hypothetical protein
MKHIIKPVSFPNVEVINQGARIMKIMPQYPKVKQYRWSTEELERLTGEQVGVPDMGSNEC